LYLIIKFKRSKCINVNNIAPIYLKYFSIITPIKIKKMNKKLLLNAAVILMGSSLLLTSCKKDEEAPVIMLSGDSVQTVILNASISDPGATADDNKDGDLSANVTSDYLTVVNKDSAGSYTVTYTVTDAADNIGTKTRMVNVTNEAAAFFDGLYNGSETDVNGPYTYSGNTNAAKTVTLTASKTKNNRVWMTRLGDYANNRSYFDVTGTSIDLPSQNATDIGTGSTADCSIASHSFQGTGAKTATGFTLNYVDTKLGLCAAAPRPAQAVFIKK
jgi:hypothetical protein